MRFALSGLALCAAVTALPLNTGVVSGLTGDLTGLTADVPQVDGVQLSGIDVRSSGNILKEDGILKEAEELGDLNALGGIKRSKDSGLLGLSEVDGVVGDVEGLGGVTEDVKRAVFHGKFGKVHAKVNSDEVVSGAAKTVKGKKNKAVKNAKGAASSQEGIVASSGIVQSAEGVAGAEKGVAQGEAGALPARGLPSVPSVGSAGGVLSEVEGLVPELESPESLVPSTDSLPIRRGIFHKKLTELGNSMGMKADAAPMDSVLAMDKASGAPIKDVQSVDPSFTPLQDAGHLLKGEGVSSLGVREVVLPIVGTGETDGLINELLGSAPDVPVSGLPVRSLPTDSLLSTVEGALNTDDLLGEVPASSLPVREVVLPIVGTGETDGLVNELLGSAPSVPVSGLPVRSLTGQLVKAGSAKSVINEVDGTLTTDGTVSEVEGIARRSDLNNGIPTGVTEVPDVNYIVSEVETIA